jgi:ribosomal protein S3AE
MRRVPFRIRIPVEGTTPVAVWTGEGSAIPVAALSLTAAQVELCKLSVIVVMTEELVHAGGAENTVQGILQRTINSAVDAHVVTAQSGSL